MRIALFGPGGQVGWELRRALHTLGEVIPVDRARVDLTRTDDVRRTVLDLRPDLVVNAAAYTAVDKAETEEALATAVNAEAPRAMARAASEIGAAIIHYSTDYVFDGRKDGAYTESDATGPTSAYGRGKLLGEQWVAEGCARHLILRTSWVYSARGGNFLLTMRRLATQRESLGVVNDQHGAPTWARTIAQATAQMIACAGPRAEAMNAAIGHRAGVYHLSAEGSTTWYEFARRIIGPLPNPALKVQRIDPLTTEQYPLPARRPANSRLSLERIQRLWGVRLPPWEEALALCLEELR